MSETNLWDVYCVEEEQFFKYVKSATKPTQCPNNAQHTLRSVRSSDRSVLVDYGVTTDFQPNTVMKLLVQQSESKTLTLPASNDIIVLANTPQEITNKSLNARSNIVTNIGDAEILPGAQIDASKIGNGSVTNNNYQHLQGTTDIVQSQINARVVGPESAVPGQIAIFSATAGKLVAASAVKTDGDRITNISNIDIAESTPTVPPAGNLRFFVSNGELFVKDPSGNDVQITNRPNDRQMANQQSTTTTTSNTYVDLSDMVLTTNFSGNYSIKYLVTFTTTCSVQTGSNITIEYILNVDGIDVDCSRPVTIGSNRDQITVSLNYLTDEIPTGTIIKIRWKGEFNNITKQTFGRTLTIHGQL